MDLQTSLATEWLETNGLGGFASSTLAGVNTRRYHGLLVAALQPPGGRHVLLSKLEETLVVAGVRYELASNLYPDTVHPAGHLYLKEFRQDPFPVFSYEAGGVVLQKRIFMIYGENTTVVEYEASGGECSLEVRPLIAFRDFHATTHANPVLNKSVQVSRVGVVLKPYPGLPCLHLNHNGEVISIQGDWYRNFQYPREAERGLDSSEDLFQPFALRFDLGQLNLGQLNLRKPAAIIAGLETHDPDSAPAMRTREASRRARLGTFAAADPFIVRRGNGLHTIIAGYHWFGDWGRDTMIALPGLTLVTGRPEIARDILLAFTQLIDQGMLPNRFTEAGDTPEYNTVDASLWSFEAIRQYLEYTGDYAFVQEHLYPGMASVIQWHLQGTRYGIHCGDDGLIEAGSPETQLTWMDAKVGDYVVTPRSGRPVEIQGLWYNALRVMEDLATRFRDRDMKRVTGETAQRARTSFGATFWNPAAECLYDCVTPAGPDPSIRPNQLFCLSLGYPVVDAPERAKAILQVVEEHLLTPYGLRTLSPSDPRYRPRYEGNALQRDGAYHQGTVWPWLLGPFITAFRRACPGDQGRVETMLSAFAGAVMIPEIYDGEAPHQARGCIAQAWSVAEILRAGRSQRPL